MEELTLPSVVTDADRAMELARIWIADNRPTFLLSGNLWDNPSTWGLLLVDFIKHVASAYAEQGHDKREILECILVAFDAEREESTAE